MGKKLQTLRETAKEFCPFYGAWYCGKKEETGYLEEHPVRAHTAMVYHPLIIAVTTHFFIISGLERLSSSLQNLGG